MSKLCRFFAKSAGRTGRPDAVIGTHLNITIPPLSGAVLIASVALGGVRDRD